MFVEQIHKDACIAQLVESMNDAYAFVDAAEPLKTINTRPKIVKRLAQQTTDCAYFIRDYADKTSLGEFCYVRRSSTCLTDVSQLYALPRMLSVTPKKLLRISSSRSSN